MVFSKRVDIYLSFIQNNEYISSTYRDIYHLPKPIILRSSVGLLQLIIDCDEGNRFPSLLKTRSLPRKTPHSGSLHQIIPEGKSDLS